MPRVTDAYREARRDEIARAAMRCLSREGFAKTTMADIIRESGLSAGAIYSHFTGKAQIAQHVARLVVTTRSSELRETVANARHPLGPSEIIAFMLAAMDRDDIGRGLLLQLWGEATVDPDVHDVLDQTVGRLRASFEEAIVPWLRDRGRSIARADVREAAEAMISLTQSAVVGSALFGADDVPAHVERIRRLLD